jgi:surface polysaccharide O-acyltransferase-like enzyme
MGRIRSIDTVRVPAILFVVIIHTNPFNGLGTLGNGVDFALDSLARFAVPFFFMTAGYLYARKRGHTTASLTADSYTSGYIRRLLSLYLFGVALLLPLKLLFTVGQAKLHDTGLQSALLAELALIFDPVYFLYYGSSLMAPLWFLPALAYSILIIAIVDRLNWARYLLPVAAFLHLVGLFGGGIGVFVDVSFRATTVVFVGLFYTTLGVKFTDWETKLSPDRSHVYLAVFLASMFARIFEVYLLGYVLGDTGLGTLADGVYTTGYTPFTIVVAASLFAYVLSRPTLGEGTRLPALGQHAVGIYIVHPAFVLALRDILARGVAATWGVHLTETIAWHLMFTPTVFIGSLVAYLGLERVGVVDAFHVVTDALFWRMHKQVEHHATAYSTVVERHLDAVVNR